MGVTGTAQLTGLFFACGVGFLIGLYYELFRTLRLLFPPTARGCFFQDVFFCLTAAVAVFFCLLAITDGVLYLYSFLGIAAGFFACYYTVGRVLHGLLAAVLRTLYRLWHALCRTVSRPFAALWRRFAPKRRKMSEKVCRVPEKSANFLKKLLKKPPRV